MEPTAVTGCSFCNYKGKLNVYMPPPWVPLIGPFRDQAPCPYCFPDQWENALHKWKNSPGYQIDPYQYSR